MGLNRRRGWVVAALGLTSFVWSGCSGSKATELVAGVSSQVQVPRDLQTIVVTVVAGRPVFQQAYPVYDGKVRLPRTLGIVAGADQSAPVTITVAGYPVDAANDAYGAIAGVSPPHVGTKLHGIDDGGGARILRVSRQPYKANHILFVPMPLRFACFDVDCEAATTTPGCEGGDCTCKGGKCVPPDPIDALIDFDDSLIYGSSNTCFRPFQDQNAAGQTQLGCLDTAVPPQVIDEANCVYVLPGSASVPNPLPPTAKAYDPLVPQQLIDLANSSEPPGQPAGTNLNVRVVYDNVVSEVLDYEGTCPAPGQSSSVPLEGYCTFADAPQKFQIADGICHNPLHKISLMTVSAGCAPKTQYQPVCDDSVQGPPQPTLPDGGSSTDGGCNVSTTLTPAPSALYVLWDKTSGMRDFFGQKAFSTVLGLSLGDAVFKQTNVAFKYTPGLQTDCTAAPSANSFANLPTKLPFPDATGTVGFEPSAQGQLDIATSLLAQAGPDGGTPDNLPPGTGPFFLESALDGAYQALIAESKTGANKEAFNKLATMIFLDRDFTNECGAPHLDAVNEALQAYQNAGIETYVVMLKNADFQGDASVNGDGVPPQAAIDHAAQLAAPHDTSDTLRPSTFFFDATGDNFAAVELEALTKVVADLGSCVYESPGNISTGANLSFLDVAPAAAGGQPVTVNIKYSGTGCAADSDSTPLWVYDNQHIHVCPQTCAKLVNSASLLQQSQIAQNIQRASQGLPPLPTIDVQVSGIEACNPATPDPKPVEAGVGTPTGGFDAGPQPQPDAGPADASAD